ncbi:hypothetical protein [Nonomuraea indica]|uniref:Uncharacterized protein n=1 Tax=Nonomuraea indica TaxID=1581193 RepID=A0ABW8A9H7_9ACTN
MGEQVCEQVGRPPRRDTAVLALTDDHPAADAAAHNPRGVSA